MKNVKISYKTIPIIERRGSFLGMQHGWQIPQQKLDWDTLADQLLNTLVILEKADNLPNNAKDINMAMAQSYGNCSTTYNTRGENREAEVVDIEDILHQLLNT